ncbi:terpene synthase 10-like [Olea europaea var. sylvestris]|uniref:terpene synthase 10-like n=1 Tax=Olea europaea var. sylvestris TaxID=158386 RepID=UPI000C1CF1C2|nr:terpene synthase 10-like [Olea europaea var. sylvestris]
MTIPQFLHPAAIYIGFLHLAVISNRQLRNNNNIWDVSSIHQLPDYMQICYLALNNFVNEMAYDILKEKGFIIIPYLRKAWKDLCKAYLQEARWYFNGYKPTMEEYMNTAWISISTHVILSHAFFAVTSPIEKEAVQYLLDYPNLIRWSATILRLSDDLATSVDEMKRGDVPKTIQCYMNETGASEDEAREHIRSLIRETWKKMNQVQETSISSLGIFCRSFLANHLLQQANRIVLPSVSWYQSVSIFLEDKFHQL